LDGDHQAHEVYAHDWLAVEVNFKFFFVIYLLHNMMFTMNYKLSIKIRQKDSYERGQRLDQLKEQCHTVMTL